jgi:hypothetical protein
MNETRPSSIGEILDRAISTYVRRWVPLFVIVAFIAVPVAILDSVISPGFTQLTGLLTKLSHVPPGHAAETARILKDFQLGSGPSGGLVLILVLQFLLLPLADTALIVFAATTLDGAQASIGSAYRTALARWFPQLVVGIAFVCLAGAAMFAFSIALAIVALAIAGVWTISHAVATVLGIVALVAAFAGLTFSAALGNVAWLMSLVSVATEDVNPFRAVGQGVRRTFDRTTLKRTIAIALTILAISWFGSLAVTVFAGVIALAVPIEVVPNLIMAAGSIVTGSISMLLIVVYLRDLRLRREGADLLLLATSPSAPQA